MFAPLLEGMDIAGKTITADALLTQRELARYLVEDRSAHYLFTAKDNQPTLLGDIRLLFKERDAPDFREPLTLEHGRLESRAIWTSTRLNDYLNFPHVGQVFAIERQTINKKTSKESIEIVYGVTDHSPESADAERLLALNRGHWGGRSTPLHPRLELGRRSLHDTHRPRSGEHHSVAPVCHRLDQVQESRQRCRNHRQACT
jgi:hypothetical protein